MFESGRGRPKKILAIDWDARTLRIVHALTGKRGVRIDRILSAGIPSDVDANSPEAMGLHIKRVLEQESIATRVAMVGIPRDQTILKTLSLPDIRPEELAGIVEIQIAKELVFPVSHAVIDFTIGGTHEGGKTRDVLVSAVRHDVIEQYKATFAAAGLKLDRIGLRPHATKVALCKMLEFSMPERVMFIDVRPEYPEIDVIRQSSLTFSRAPSLHFPDNWDESTTISLVRDEHGAMEVPSLAAGAGEAPSLGLPAVRPSSMDRMIGDLVMEVTKSIEAYRAADPGASMDQVVIGGDTGVEERLSEAIQKRLGIATELYNPAVAFGWEPDEGAGAVGFAPTLGLVLDQVDDSGLHFDFLHPKKMVSATQARLKKAPLVAAVVVLFCAATVLGAWQYTKNDRKTLAVIESQIEELEGTQDNDERFLRLMDDLREFDQKQYIWIDEWYDIFALLPSNQELVINSLEMDQADGRIKLKTKARQRELALQLVDKLQAFRREGRDKPRYVATIGQQSENKGDAYPFVQEFTINIQGDGPDKRGRSRKTSSGS